MFFFSLSSEKKSLAETKKKGMARDREVKRKGGRDLTEM